jgi:hypothetical protein
MGSMGMDGKRPFREGYHVRNRGFSLRGKIPRSQCLVSAVANNKQDVRTASWPEGMTLFIRDTIHQCHSCRSPLMPGPLSSRRASASSISARRRSISLRRRAFLQSLQQPLLSRQELCEARHRTILTGHQCSPATPSARSFVKCRCRSVCAGIRVFAAVGALGFREARMPLLRLYRKEIPAVRGSRSEQSGPGHSSNAFQLD